MANYYEDLEKMEYEAEQLEGEIENYKEEMEQIEDEESDEYCDLEEKYWHAVFQLEELQNDIEEIEEIGPDFYNDDPCPQRWAY